MKIIIPMTGYGSRFVEAGYKELKPFIRVQGKPIIQWIVEGMYPNEKDIVFICRQEHLDNIENMQTDLLKICPTATIFSIKDWIKKGPVYDVLRAIEIIGDEEPCIINYCDFYQIWNWEKFKHDLEDRNCEGCIPTYTGFHPHLLIEKNVYASCRVDDNDDLIEIREKFSFEKDKSNTKHSPGVYYFKNGEILKKYCQMMVDKQDTLNGEFYASLPYNYMVRDGLKVWVPSNVDYFCQWGTPEDLEEYLFWSDCILKKRRKMNILIPMAGEGQRFKNEGYQVHKPAIYTIDRESGCELPMVICATKDLPGVEENANNVTYIDRTFHRDDGVEKEILKHYSKARFITLEELTEGQASTCLMAKPVINNEVPLLIAACDNGMEFDDNKFWDLTMESDVIVFTYRNNPSVLENPNAYGWVITDENNQIVDLSIKKQISDDPMKDHAIVATFWFKKGSIFVKAAEKMIEENDKINNEFYVDEVIKHCLQLGYRCNVFEIERYIGWGTPKDYENYMNTYKYWKDYVAETFDL